MIMTNVFLSYSARDHAEADALETELERLGFQAFNPMREIRADENWRDAIRAAVKRADAVVLLINSPLSAQASWVSYEAGLADALGKPIIVLASHRYAARDLPSDIASWQILDFDPNEPARTARNLAEQIVAPT
jgi:nucleoside 2-deoxyribosyltransferase